MVCRKLLASATSVQNKLPVVSDALQLLKRYTHCLLMEQQVHLTYQLAYIARAQVRPAVQNAESSFEAMAAGTKRKYYMISGKGGVGKTSLAASLAVKFAAAGHPTLVVSTDPAHSLSDSLDQVSFHRRSCMCTSDAFLQYDAEEAQPFCWVR